MIDRLHLLPFVKRLLPQPAYDHLERWRIARATRAYQQLPPAEMFARIYADGFWGKPKDPAQRFFSGSGTHSAELSGAYVQAVRQWLDGLGLAPDVVDLGCGDFHVGSQLRSACGRYVACDIVAPLIEHNRQKFSDMDVDFRVLDLAIDDLPEGDVAFVRQVLQHCSNSQIQAVVPKLASRYKYLVVTEHVPLAPSFPHNLDKPAGPDIRLQLGSGVVLTSPPFDLRVAGQSELLSVPEQGGLIRTIVYALAQ